MGKCTGCGVEKEWVHGKKCAECRRKYLYDRWRIVRKNKECPICKTSHMKLTMECSTKCKILNRHKVENGCWVWKGKLNESGYGNFQETRNGKKVDLMAHRESYKEFIGKIPIGKLVLHACDNPACCNPDHLWLGDQKDNTRDMFLKNRGAKQKLKIEDVKKIKQMIVDGMRNCDILKNFNVHKSTIASIRGGFTWKYVTS